MYAVGLGAAILSQFRLDDGKVVSVLADGGMGKGGYPIGGVHDRLDESFQSFAGRAGRLRIDLMIGTHYDEDHLKGLIPIAADDGIEIGDVWLPPVKDETDEIPGHVSETDDYLALRFYDDEGEQRLRNYLDSKRKFIEEVQRQEERVEDRLREAGENVNDLPGYRPRNSDERRYLMARLRDFRPEGTDGYVEYFRNQEKSAAEALGNELAHGSAEFDSSVNDLRDLAIALRRHTSSADFSRYLEGPRFLEQDSQALRFVPAALASIRESAAANAITASHLHKLVQALKSRQKPVRPQCHYISAGSPVRFVWTTSKRRFIPRSQGGDPALVINLLGPSDALVEKHRARLPVGSYLMAMSRGGDPIRLESITANNQLSYILTVRSNDQGILISGDSGCYGFKDRYGEYWAPLLEGLHRLHVVQVAHHAGRNYDFYNCLREAGFAARKDAAYLLLSHEVHDHTRPSDAFAQFVAQVRREDDDPCLLFTSEPNSVRVRDFDELICPVVPAGTAAQKGDVRLSWTDQGGRPGWTLEKHAVAVKPS